jgi:hypothetical protein
MSIDLYRHSLVTRVHQCRESEADIQAHEVSLIARQHAVREMQLKIAAEERKANDLAAAVKLRSEKYTAMQTQLVAAEDALRAHHELVKSAIVEDGKRTAIMLGEQVKRQNEETTKILAGLARQEEEAKKAHVQMLIQLQPDNGSLGRLVQEKAGEIRRQDEELKRKEKELEERRQRFYQADDRFTVENANRMKAAAAFIHVPGPGQARVLPSLPHFQQQQLQQQQQFQLQQRQQLQPAPTLSTQQQIQQVLLQRQQMMLRQQQMYQQQPMQFVPVAENGIVGGVVSKNNNATSGGGGGGGGGRTAQQQQRPPQ